MKKFIAILMSSTMLFAPLAFAADENAPAANANTQMQSTENSSQDGTQTTEHHKMTKHHKNHACECECKGKKHHHKTVHHKKSTTHSSEPASTTDNTQNTNTNTTNPQ